jgi:hypothetical protein
MDGAPCMRGTDCAAGFECIGSGQCAHYCCQSQTCDDARGTYFCDIQPMIGGGPYAKVPVCMKRSDCKLLMKGSCQDNQTCAVVREHDGYTSCVDVGPRKVGEECDTDHCAAGLVCLGMTGHRSCYQLCHTDVTTECPPMQKCTGSAPVFTDPTIGICQP